MKRMVVWVLLVAALAVGGCDLFGDDGGGGGPQEGGGDGEQSLVERG